MKLFISFVTILVLLMIIGAASLKLDNLQIDIRSSEPFQFEGKEWHCAYTPKQVDINILEEQIKELKK